MCLALRKDVACGPELWGAQSHWPIDYGRALEISGSALFCREHWGPESWLARDYMELVADFWLEARSFYSQFGIFPFDYCWKCLLLSENNSRWDMLKCKLNNQLPLHMGRVHCYLVLFGSVTDFEEWVWCGHYKRTRKIWSLFCVVGGYLHPSVQVRAFKCSLCWSTCTQEVPLVNIKMKAGWGLGGWRWEGKWSPSDSQISE